MAFTTNTLEEIKARMDIIDIISEHVALKKSGRNWLGLCPFHPEKTPSFMVNTDKNIFKCFGCGAGGDAFTFLQRINNLSFAEVMSELASRYGIKVDYSSEKTELKDQILEINKEATKFYTDTLFDTAGKEALAYLHGRGITDEIIFQFNLGFVPDGWDNLLNHLNKTHKYPIDLIDKAGLITKRPNSEGYYDRFRNRVIVPIHNDRGQIIAFGGRSLSEEVQPKYLNSPETPLFYKGKNLYALYQARESIKSEDCVILMEGYFDAISAHANGITNVVATLGTALTSDQLRILGKYTQSKQVVIAFDADLAGRNATDRGIEVIKNTFGGLGGIKLLDSISTRDSAYNVRIVSVPEGKDPDDYVRLKGAEAFKKLIKNAPLLIDFQIEQILKANEIEKTTGKLKAVKELAELFADIASPIVRTEYIRTLSDRLKVSEEDFTSELKRLKPGTSLKRRPIESSNSQALKRKTPEKIISEAERNLISIYFLKESYWKLTSSELKEVIFTSTELQTIKAFIENFIEDCKNIDELTKRLFDTLSDNIEAMEILSDIIFSIEDKLCMDNESSINLFIKENLACIARFKSQSKEKEIKEKYHSLKDDEIKSLELQYEVKNMVLTRLSTQ